MLLISYIRSKNQQQVRTKHAQLLRTKYAQLVQHTPVASVARIKYKKELNMQVVKN